MAVFPREEFLLCFVEVFAAEVGYGFREVWGAEVVPVAVLYLLLELGGEVFQVFCVRLHV